MGLAYVSSSVMPHYIVRGCAHWWSVPLGCVSCRSPSHLVPPSRLMCHRLPPCSTVCAPYVRARGSSYPKKCLRDRRRAHQKGLRSTVGQTQRAVFQQKTNQNEKNFWGLSPCNYSRFSVCRPIIANKSFSSACKTMSHHLDWNHRNDGTNKQRIKPATPELEC